MHWSASCWCQRCDSLCFSMSNTYRGSHSELLSSRAVMNILSGLCFQLCYIVFNASSLLARVTKGMSMEAQLEGGQLSPSVWPHNPATGFWLSSATVVSAEPFSRRTGTLWCLRKEMATCRHWSVLVARPRRCHTLSNPVLWQSIERQLIPATLCRCTLHSVSWLTNYGPWHAYEKERKNTGHKRALHWSLKVSLILVQCLKMLIVRLSEQLQAYGLSAVRWTNNAVSWMICRYNN